MKNGILQPGPRLALLHSNAITVTVGRADLADLVKRLEKAEAKLNEAAAALDILNDLADERRRP